MRYVVDAGRSKQKILEEGGSLAQYDVRWISKASAQQRAGRSGRTGPGHCYRSSLSCLAPSLPCIHVLVVLLKILLAKVPNTMANPDSKIIHSFFFMSIALCSHTL